MYEPRTTATGGALQSSAALPGHAAHSKRANSHARRAARAALGLCLAAALAGQVACDGGATTAASPSDIERDVRDLHAALVPLDPGAYRREQGDWKARRELTLRRLRQGTPALGRRLLALLDDGTSLIPEVRRGMLDVAAHTAAKDALPVLRATFETYGLPVDERAAACELLGALFPATAVELLGPILSESRPTTTLPPYELMISSFVTACDRGGFDKADVLAGIATDFLYDDAARHRAVKELGSVSAPISAQALESVLVESTGNGYLRRLAAQALLTAAPAECCAVFRRTIDHEADVNFVLFLDDMIGKNCL